MWGQVARPPDTSYSTMSIGPARLADPRRMVPRTGTVREHEQFLPREVLSFAPRPGNSSGFLTLEPLALAYFYQPVSTAVLIFFSHLQASCLQF